MSTIEEQLKERFATFERRRNGINDCNSGCSENISREQKCENSDYRGKATNEERRDLSQKSNLKQQMDIDGKYDEKDKEEEKNLKIQNITEKITKLVNEIQRHQKNINDLSRQVNEEQEKKNAKEKRLQELTTMFRSLHAYEEEKIPSSKPGQFEESSLCAEATVNNNVSFDEEIAKQLQAQYEREEEEEKLLEEEKRLEEEKHLEQGRAEQESARQRREQQYYHQQFLKEQMEMEQEFARRNQYFQNFPEPSLIRQPQPYSYSIANSNRYSTRSSTRPSPNFHERLSRSTIMDSDDDNTIHNYNTRYYNN